MVKLNAVSQPISIEYKMVHGLTLLSTGEGGFLARAIRLAARTLEPFHLEFPNFLTSFYAFWTYCGEISGKLICRGVAAVIFEQKVMKN